MQEIITLKDLSDYSAYEYIEVIPHWGSMQQCYIANYVNDFTICKFYRKDIINVWCDTALEDIKEDKYLDTEAKQVLLAVLNREKEYCWLIDYIIDGHNYNDICYIEDTEIQNQNDIDKWILEIMDWVYHDYSSWKLVK